MNRKQDEFGGLLPIGHDRGKVMNGECGAFGCSTSPANVWDRTIEAYVCQAHAREKNARWAYLWPKDLPPCGAK